MTRAFQWLAVVFALASALSILVNLPNPLRSWVVLAFLLLGPGLAFSRLLSVRQVSIHLTLAIAMSLAIDTAVSEGLVMAGLMSPNVAMGILIVLTLIGSSLPVSGRRADDEDGLLRQRMSR